MQKHAMRIISQPKQKFKIFPTICKIGAYRQKERKNKLGHFDEKKLSLKRRSGVFENLMVSFNI